MSERPDAAMYRRVFDGHHEGRLILEDLVMRFTGQSFVKGGRAGERQQCFQQGERSVVEWIVNQTNRDPIDPNEGDEGDGNSNSAGNNA